MIEQLTVFIQNEKGRLSGLCRTLADANINMHDLFIADTSDFGVVRVFCDTPQAAAKVLDEAGFRASVTKVLAVRVPNEPGGLATCSRPSNRWAPISNTAIAFRVERPRPLTF